MLDFTNSALALNMGAGQSDLPHAPNLSTWLCLAGTLMRSMSYGLLGNTSGKGRFSTTRTALRKQPRYRK